MWRAKEIFQLFDETKKWLNHFGLPSRRKFTLEKGRKGEREKAKKERRNERSKLKMQSQADKYPNIKAGQIKSSSPFIQFFQHHLNIRNK